MSRREHAAGSSGMPAGSAFFWFTSGPGRPDLSPATAAVARRRHSLGRLPADSSSGPAVRSGWRVQVQPLRPRQEARVEPTGYATSEGAGKAIQPSISRQRLMHLDATLLRQIQGGSAPTAERTVDTASFPPLPPPICHLDSLTLWRSSGRVCAPPGRPLQFTGSSLKPLPMQGLRRCLIL